MANAVLDLCGRHCGERLPDSTVKLHVEVRSIRRSWTFLKLLFAMLHTYSMPLNSGWYGTFHTIEKPNECA